MVTAYLCRRHFQEQRAVQQALVTTNFLCFKCKRLSLMFSPPEHNCVYEYPSTLSSTLYYPSSPPSPKSPCSLPSRSFSFPSYGQFIRTGYLPCSRFSSQCCPVPSPPPHIVCSPCSGRLTNPPVAPQIPHSPYPKGATLSICSLPVLLCPPNASFMHTFSVPFPATHAAQSSLPLRCKSFFCFWILCTFPQDFLSPTFLHSALSDSIPPPFAQHSIQPGTR